MFSRGSARSGIDTPDISKITYGPEEFWHELAQIVLARFGTTLAPFGTKDLLVCCLRFPHSLGSSAKIPARERIGARGSNPRAREK